MAFRLSFQLPSRQLNAVHGAAITAMLGMFSPSPALADIMLYPTRIVIEGSKRSAQVEIVNRGQEPETYRLNIVNRRMSDLGEIVPADTAQPGEQFADALLRYTPRQITLQPGASQTVRLSVRKPSDLPPGEYRSHLQFDRVPDSAGSADLEQAAMAASNELSIVLKALIGASIPVIVRHGQTNASVTLGSLKFEPVKSGASPELSFTFWRTGNRSTYGDVVAIYTAPGRKPVEVGAAKGIAVYVPNAERRARLPLKLPDGTTLRGGELQLRYNERLEDGGALIAQAAVPVP
jgi:P pilus assembly chaperone PapD